MRRALSSLALLGLLATPSTARPCDYVPQFVGGYPGPEDSVPITGQGFAKIPFMGRFAMQAELILPDAFAPIPFDTRSLGEHDVELLFPTPMEAGPASAEVWLVDQPDVRWRTEFTVDAAADRVPPAGTTAEFSSYDGPSNSCESSGTYVQARADLVPDDDVLFYELVEMQPNDGQLIWGTAWPRLEQPVADILITANVGLDPLQGRCFVVRTVDRSGNRSTPSNMSCFGQVVVDAGVPAQLDAGVTDAGTNPDAAAAVADAAQGPQLAAKDSGCGCSSAPGAPANAAGGLALLVIAGVGRRRRRKRE